MISSKRLIFFGTSDFSLGPLQMLIEQGYDIVAAVTKADARSGRHHSLTSPAVKLLADKYNIEVMQPTSLREVAAEIKSLRPDAGIVVSYGKIIPQSVIDLFPLGLVNIHASFLPKYRGASPIEASILAGDSTVGVSLMRIDAGLDSGPVYATKAIAMPECATKPQLYELLSTLGTQLLSDSLNKILAQDLRPHAQDEKLVSHVGIIKKEAGNIDWSKPAIRIEREIRAYLGWPSSRTQLFDKDIIITSARISPESLKGTVGQPIINDQQLYVRTGVGVLEIVRLKPAGRSDMPVSAFLAGLSTKNLL